MDQELILNTTGKTDQEQYLLVVLSVTYNYKQDFVVSSFDFFAVVFNIQKQTIMKSLVLIQDPVALSMEANSAAVFEMTVYSVTEVLKHTIMKFWDLIQDPMASPGVTNLIVVFNATVYIIINKHTIVESLVLIQDQVSLDVAQRICITRETRWCFLTCHTLRTRVEPN